VASYHGSNSGENSTFVLFSLFLSLTHTELLHHTDAAPLVKTDILSSSLSYTHTHTQTPGATSYNFNAVVDVILSLFLTFTHTHIHTPGGALYRGRASCKDNTAAVHHQCRT